MNDLSGTTEQRINSLHEGLKALLQRGIEQALEIGKLLTEKKSELKHGQLGQWIRDNLIFSERTAQRYMNLFETDPRLRELITSPRLIKCSLRKTTMCRIWSSLE